MFNRLRKLFVSQKSQRNLDVKTIPLSEYQLAEAGLQVEKFSPPQTLIGTATSTGKARDHNEDSIFTFYSSLGDNNQQIPFGLFIVADGMGGHQHGEVASRVAVRVMADYIFEHLYRSLLAVEPVVIEKSILEIVEEGVQASHKMVQRRAPGGGTTLTAMLLIGDQMTIAHVGDSRAYGIKANQPPELLTHDHSLAHRLQDLGQITAEEASVHPHRNVLYRALGQTESFRPDVRTYPVTRPGNILLCSDGLWGVITDSELQQYVMSSDSPSLACHRLVEAANNAGGPDNISVILVKHL